MKDDSKDSNERAEERNENEEKGVDAAASDESKLHGHEPDEDDDEDEDDDDEVEAASPPSKPSDKPRSKAKSAVKSRRSSKASSVKSSSRKPGNSSNAGIYVAVALIAGAAAGWFAREARGKSVSAEVHAASAAGEGPCEAWQKQLCESAGEQSAACGQAKSAAELLSAEACGVALEDVPATLEKVKAARADCDTLVNKLCKDLGEQTGTCKMVRERTESFPPERCKEMLGSFDKVLSQLQSMEKRGGPGGPHGGPPGASPHGGPPGASPHGGPPGASPQGGPPDAKRPSGNIQLNTGPARKVTPPPAKAEPTAPATATP